MRKIIAAILLAAGLSSVLAAAAVAGEMIAVIVHRDNPTGLLSEAEIRMIYTNKRLQWPDGTPMVLYDLAVQNPLRSVFSEAVLGKTAYKVAEDWAHLKITNQAKNPPMTIKSQSLIIKRVAEDRGAIGYVSLKEVRGKEGIKIINTLQ